MRSLGFPEFIIILVVLVVLMPFSKIFSKAGYSGWLSLALFFPVINVLVLFWFAYSDWPALRRNSRIDSSRA